MNFDTDTIWSFIVNSCRDSVSCENFFYIGGHQSVVLGYILHLPDNPYTLWNCSKTVELIKVKRDVFLKKFLSKVGLPRTSAP